MGKIFSFTAETLNGEILELPQQYEVSCDSVRPMGVMQIRAWDVNDCIVVRTVFGVMYGKNLLGTTQFYNLQDYDNYIASQCGCCEGSIIGCDSLLVDGCTLKIGDCFLKILQ